MRRHFVPARRDLANELRMALGNPPEHKKRGTQSVRLEEIEQPVRVRYDTAVEHIPRSSRDDPVERRGLKVVLDVNAHRVDHVPALDESRRRHRPPRRNTTIL